MCQVSECIITVFISIVQLSWRSQRSSSYSSLPATPTTRLIFSTPRAHLTPFIKPRTCTSPRPRISRTRPDSSTNLTTDCVTVCVNWTQWHNTQYTTRQHDNTQYTIHTIHTIHTTHNTQYTIHDTQYSTHTTHNTQYDNRFCFFKSKLI